MDSNINLFIDPNIVIGLKNVALTSLYFRVPRWFMKIGKVAAFFKLDLTLSLADF